MRVVTLDSWDKALVIVAHGVWGSSHNRFSGWKVGEEVVVLVGREGVVTAKTSGSAYRSDLAVWDNGLYERRVPLGSVRIVDDEKGSRLNSGVRGILGKCYLPQSTVMSFSTESGWPTPPTPNRQAAEVLGWMLAGR